mmetsp:Transcript_8660/g.12625  ORF Transcript_8660/g.12625 Transcript_8660/m.12625 type:complete len:80 (-) Transcript_8660:174-413(-)
MKKMKTQGAPVPSIKQEEGAPVQSIKQEVHTIPSDHHTIHSDHSAAPDNEHSAGPDNSASPKTYSVSEWLLEWLSIIVG